MLRCRPFSQWASRVPAQCTPLAAQRGESGQSKGKQCFLRRSREYFAGGHRLRLFSHAPETSWPRAAFDDFDTATLRRTIFPRERSRIARRRRTRGPTAAGGGRFPKSERSGFRRRRTPPTCCFPRRRRSPDHVFRTSPVNSGQPVRVAAGDRRTSPAGHSDITFRNRRPVPVGAEWPTPDLAGFPRPRASRPGIQRRHRHFAALIRSIRRPPGRKNKIVDQEFVPPFW